MKISKTSAIDRLFTRIEERPFYFHRVFFAVVFVGGLRWLEDDTLARLGHGYGQVIHYSAWYLLLYMCISAAVGLATGKGWKKTSSIVSYGIYIGIFPPWIDALYYGLGNFSYRYMLEFNWTFTGADFPIGETIVLWVSVAAAAGYGLQRTKSLLRGFGAGFAVYAVFLFCGWLLPKFAKEVLMAKLFFGESLMAQNLIYTQWLIAVMIGIFFLIEFKALRHVLLRTAHALPFVAAVGLGAQFEGGYSARVLYLMFFVLLIHVLIIGENDYFDRAQDRFAGRNTLVSDYHVYFFRTFILWLALSFFILHVSIGILFTLYYIATLAYHHDSTRLKQICPINYKTEGVVGMFAYFIGAFALSKQHLSAETVIGGLLAFGGFSLVSMFKDYKDIDADRAGHVKTIYIWGESRGWPLQKTHRLVTAIVTVTLLLAPFLVLMTQSDISGFALGLVVVLALATPICLVAFPKKLAVTTSLWSVTFYIAALSFCIPSN